METPPKTIISASRRTDIPAFHGDWFMERIAAGGTTCINPFNGAEYTVSLRREDVALFVFWSKDFAPFLPHLETLDRLGYKFYFHYTINGYPAWLEPGVPPLERHIETARRLAERFGPERLLWRFDPIVFSSETPPEYVFGNFARIAAALEGASSRCYTSFAQLYGKVRRRFAEVNEERGTVFHMGEEFRKKNERPGGCIEFDLSERERRDFAARMATAAAARGISLFACCQDYLQMPFGSPPILKASCIDFELAARICGEYPAGAANPTRKQCGCHLSRDIGAYDTCRHACAYCYAAGG